MTDMSDPANYERLLAVEPAPPVGVAARTSQPQQTPREPAVRSALELVKVEVQPDPTRHGALGPAERMEQLASRIDQIGATVRAIAERLGASLEESPEQSAERRWQMSEIHAEFGLSLEAETGLVVCKGKTAATFSVSMTWTTRSPRGGASERAPGT
jgi:hypothetical protein